MLCDRGTEYSLRRGFRRLSDKIMRKNAIPRIDMRVELEKVLERALEGALDQEAYANLKVYLETLGYLIHSWRTRTLRSNDCARSCSARAARRRARCRQPKML